MVLNDSKYVLSSRTNINYVCLIFRKRTHISKFLNYNVKDIIITTFASVWNYYRDT